MLRCLLADDEEPARSRLKRLLQPYIDAGRMAIVSEAEDGVMALDALHTQDIDVAFLDIQMPGLDGFGVLDRLGEEDRPHLIFVTAYNEFAVRAFEEDALDYLLKPVSRERLDKAVERAESRMAPPPPPEFSAEHLSSLVAQLARQSGREAYLPHVSVTQRDRILLVPTADIVSMEVHEGITRLFALDPAKEGKPVLRQLPASYTLEQLEARLDPELFMRVHRGALIGLKHIREVHLWFSGRYKLLLTGGHEVVASRERSRLLRDRLAL